MTTKADEKAEALRIYGSKMKEVSARAARGGLPEYTVILLQECYSQEYMRHLSRIDEKYGD